METESEGSLIRENVIEIIWISREGCRMGLQRWLPQSLTVWCGIQCD